MYNLRPEGRIGPRPFPELKKRRKGRKGVIDWFIYRERIQTTLPYLFTIAAQRARRGIVIMEDNTPVDMHHYDKDPREKLDLQKLA